jgi:hypothetical protein
MERKSALARGAIPSISERLTCWDRLSSRQKKTRIVLATSEHKPGQYLRALGLHTIKLGRIESQSRQDGRAT